MFSIFEQSGGVGWPFGTEVPIGRFLGLFYYLSRGDISNLIELIIVPIGITVGLFFLIVFLQAINVEIPLSFGRVRGQTIKWPLNFFYSGVIPVIFISALRANIQLLAQILQNKVGETGFLSFVSSNIIGRVEQGVPISGLVKWVSPVSLVGNISALATVEFWLRILSYSTYMIVGSVIFAWLWVQTSGQDSKSVAKQIINSGLQIPGFRKDEKIIERILNRYINPLTILGGIGVGLLASTADILSALSSGTGILLLIMIIYQFYQQIGRESMDDFGMLKRLMRK